MRRVLFVDDEQFVLDGLRDLLRKQRHQWDMVFALGGQAALHALEHSAFDVVVSDMRMPGMDGAELLAKVKERYPATARIILSGHAERESVVRALPVAHQFLSKPCDATLLRVVVERACELQRILQDAGIRTVIGKLDKLPSVPHTYWELTRAASRPDVALADLTSIVEQDPAMVVKLLQLVNSAYFGLAQRISSVQQAVSYLGTDLLRALALTIHAFGTVNASPVPGFTLEALQAHSLLTARLCQKLAPNALPKGEAFTAALVHDIGKLVLAVGVPDAYALVVEECRATGAPFHQVEKSQLGVTHAEVGAYLLGVWGLPLAIVEAVAFHHVPGLVTEGDVSTLAWVHLVDALARESAAANGAAAGGLLDLAFLARAGLSEQLDAMRARARAFLAERSPK